MADTCLLCNKKIGLMGKVGTAKYETGSICGACISQLNKALEVYYQNTDGYTLTQLETVYSHMSELIAHRVELSRIDTSYNEKIATLKEELRRKEYELHKIEQAIAKEAQRRQLEYQKEIEEANREDGRDSSGKKVKWSAEEREMLKEQKYYIRHGMKLEADNVDKILARQENTYWTFVQELNEGMDKAKQSEALIVESAKKEIEYLQTMVTIFNGMRICEKFSYTFLTVPEEKMLLGFVGKEETRSKDFGNAIKIITATITDTMGKQTVTGRSISQLSYRELAEMYQDYLHIMEDYDIRIAKAEGELEAQTLGLRASEVYGNPEHVEPDKRTCRIMSDNLEKCRAEYIKRRKSLREKYTEILSAPNTEEKAGIISGSTDEYGKKKDEFAAKEEADRRAEAERKAQEAAAVKAKEEQARKAKEAAEAKERARLETELRIKAEAEAKARIEAEQKAKAEAEKNAREEAARQAKAEEARRAKEEAEAKEQAKLETELRIRAEAEAKVRLEAEQRAKAEADRKAQEEAAAQAEAKRLEREQRREDRKNNPTHLAWAGLVLGIVTYIMLVTISPVALLTSIAGILLGIRGLKSTKKRVALISIILSGAIWIITLVAIIGIAISG